ncbi:MAG TPA: acyltransferase [Spirochaetota bacterium]|nr:acyltransferase [Spirochaetota bacterium]
MENRSRLDYLDNLKVFLTALVIVHHVGQAYGNTGGFWFFTHPGTRVPNLGYFFFFNASFFMGLFFFISGYFFPGSFDRHGAKKFITDRLIRFGIPCLFVLFIMEPVLLYAHHVTYLSDKPFFSFYLLNYFGIGPKNEFFTGPQYNLSHMWFVEHLLIYAFVYSAYRLIAARFFPSFRITKRLSLHVFAVIGFVFVIGFVTDIVRNPLGYPMDRWTGLFGFWQMEPAHFPQYVTLFFLGILAYRTGLLESITLKRNILWFAVGAGIFLFTIIRSHIIGRAAYSHWEYREALVCAGACIGLLALFRTLFNKRSAFTAFLSANAFGAYVLHVAIITPLQFLIMPASESAVMPFIIVSVLGVPLSFMASAALRMIPGMKRIL